MCIKWTNEFQYGLDEDIDMDLVLLPNKEVFVAYSWNWVEEDGLSKSDEAIEVAGREGVANEDTDDSEEESSTITHTVTFKCIGVTHESSYQTTLEYVAEAQEEVPVRLSPEPENPKDSSAIAFQCCVNGEWRRVGYVVNEVLQEVHDCLASGTITAVKFAWVKFLLSWSHSGPGYYTGINISKKGKS